MMFPILSPVTELALATLSTNGWQQWLCPKPSITDSRCRREDGGHGAAGTRSLACMCACVCACVFSLTLSLSNAVLSRKWKKIDGQETLISGHSPFRIVYIAPQNLLLLHAGRMDFSPLKEAPSKSEIGGIALKISVLQRTKQEKDFRVRSIIQICVTTHQPSVLRQVT